jgi:dienelactone hydrolase
LRFWPAEPTVSRIGLRGPTAAQEDQVSVTTRTVRYEDGTAKLTGFLACPGQRRPGRIIVVHGGAGLDDHAREQAVRFADHGYEALACDMYGEGVTGARDRVLATIEALRGDRDAVSRRVDAARAAPAEWAAGPARYAVIGYCFGGMIALEYARSGADIACAISVHGSLATPAAAAPGRVTARILVCHGGSDPHVPFADVDHFVQEMTSAQADWQLNIYGGAVHGFTHRAAATLRNGVAYHADADRRSFAAIRDLLTEAL